MPNIKLKYYGYHPYNNPTHSERNVELPMAFWFLRHFSSDPSNLIEVGEVTPFYRKPRHLVYDIAAEKPDTLRKDAAEIEYAGKNVLSISTIEHIGTSDYGQTPDSVRLKVVLEKMLCGKNYLITFALGYNRQLEEMVKDKRFLVMERTARTLWKQTATRNLDAYRYHSPWYAGNGLCVLTNLPDLHFEFQRRGVLSLLGRCGAPAWSWKNLAHAILQENSDRRSQRKPTA